MKTVLWGDNECTLLGMARGFLETYFPNSSMDAATTPAEVIELVSNKKYDLVITDFNYNNSLTGLDVIRIIRNDYPTTPIYLCTNRIVGEKMRAKFNLTQPLQKRALEAGATGFFSKFDLKDDPEKVAIILRKYLG